MFKKIVILSLVLFFISQTGSIFANSEKPPENSGGLWEQLNANIKKQDKLRQKIANAQAQEKNLSNQISVLNSEIDLTRLKIQENETRLEQLAGDIGDVKGKLEETKGQLQFTHQVASLRLRAIYEQSFSADLDAFLGSSSFNDFLARQKYTEAIRAQDVELLESLEVLQNDLDSQKKVLENKQDKEESLRADLEKQKADLASQQDSKSYILGITKNNEKEYQRLLAQVQTEIASIAAALGGGGVRIGPVKSGEVIAFQGNTGCSTGTHLHFGLYIGGAVNPKSYLDSGSLRWPESNPTVTQWYGANYSWYMANFGMPGHNGIDMTKYNGAPIYAARGGTAYLNYDSSVCWLTGTRGKGITIHHSNGWKTIYWHIR